MGITSIASAPEFIGVKLSGIPVALQTTHQNHFAGYSAKLAGLMVPGCRQERICRVENKIHCRVHSCPAPSVPFDVLQLSVC